MACFLHFCWCCPIVGIAWDVTCRFNDFYTRYASLLNNKVTSTTTSTATSTSTSTSSSATSRGASTYAPSYKPLLRRRQLEVNDITTLTTTATRPSTVSYVTSATSPTTPTGGTTSNALQRRTVMWVFLITTKLNLNVVSTSLDVKRHPASKHTKQTYMFRVSFFFF